MITTSDKVFEVIRRTILPVFAALLLFANPALAQTTATDPLPSWNDTGTSDNHLQV